jgi:hypothetical protein
MLSFHQFLRFPSGFFRSDCLTQTYMPIDTYGVPFVNVANKLNQHRLKNCSFFIKQNSLYDQLNGFMFRAKLGNFRALKTLQNT